MISTHRATEHGALRGVFYHSFFGSFCSASSSSSSSSPFSLYYNVVFSCREVYSRSLSLSLSSTLRIRATHTVIGNTPILVRLLAAASIKRRTLTYGVRWIAGAAAFVRVGSLSLTGTKKPCAAPHRHERAHTIGETRDRARERKKERSAYVYDTEPDQWEWNRQRCWSTKLHSKKKKEKKKTWWLYMHKRTAHTDRMRLHQTR